MLRLILELLPYRSQHPAGDALHSLEAALVDVFH